MKNKLVLAVIFSLITASCTNKKEQQVDFLEKEIGLYSFVDYDDVTPNSITSYPNTKISLKYFEEHPDILYASVSDYCYMLNNRIGVGCAFSVSDLESMVTFQASSPAGYVFASIITPSSKDIILAGNLSSSLISQDYSKTSLLIGLHETGSIVKQTINYHTYSYAKTSYKSYRYNKRTYFPLSLLDAMFSESAGINLFYNYKRIIQIDKPEGLNSYYYINEDGHTVSAYSEMTSLKHTVTNKKDIIEDRKNSFYFVMENLYGLASVKRIPSMIDYIKSSKFASSFDEEDDYKRTEGFYGFIASLDDGHTAIPQYSSQSPWSEGSFPRFGDLWNNRIALRNDLAADRSSMYQQYGKNIGDTIYSQDGSLAYYSFDEFMFDFNAYDEQGHVREDLYKTDSFFNLLRMFKDVENHQGVKDVVIDVSCNGGGVLGTMMKMLALISNNNSSDIFIGYNDIGLVQKEELHVDSNLDGKYDSSDAYGNRGYDIHILTSDFSFSCGNAYPFYAKQNGHASIIGQNSGGGECTVGQHLLPTGEVFNHSSLMHIGWFENDKWQGDEGGAGVDINIEYENFYDIEYLDTLLS